MEHPSATKREYDIFIERWTQTRSDYTLEDIADAWEYYQSSGRLSKPEGEPIVHESKSPPSRPSGKGSGSPVKRSPEVGCGKRPGVDEYVRVLESLAIEMDESHHAFTVAAMKTNGDTGLLIQVNPKSAFVVEITRTILGLGDGILVVRGNPEVGRHERVDVLPLVRTYLKPFVSGKNAVVNLALANRAYRNRQGCNISLAQESMRRDLVSELSAILDRSGEDVLAAFRDPGILLLTPETRARIALYAAVKKATSTNYTDPLKTISTTYTTSLGGRL